VQAPFYFGGNGDYPIWETREVRLNILRIVTDTAPDFQVRNAAFANTTVPAFSIDKPFKSATCSALSNECNFCNDMRKPETR
jgi:hypothetical protein